MSTPGSIGGGNRDMPSSQQLRRIEDLLKEHGDLVAEFGLAPTITFRQQLNRVLVRQRGEQIVRRIEPSHGGSGATARRRGQLA
jgi:hypothetical protein